MFSKNFKFTNEYILGLCQQVQELTKQNKLDQAETMLLSALGQQPNDPNLIFSLGSVYQFAKKYPLAIQLYKRVIMMAPNVIATHNNLGGCFHQEGNDEEALESYKLAALLTNYKDIDVLNNLAGLYVNSWNPEDGIKYSDMSLALSAQQKKDNPHGEWNKSLLCLELERFEEGFKLYESGIKTGDRKFKDYGGIPEWKGEPCSSLIVCGEQGIGDEIMFSSILPDVAKRVDKIIFDCHPRLSEMFSWHKVRSDCDYIVTPNRKQVNVDYVKEFAPEFRINVGSLGQFFRHKIEDFPKKEFLDIPSNNVFNEIIRNNNNNKHIVGISWFGGAKQTRADLRSIPLESLVPLLNCSDNIHWVNLQYNIEKATLDGFNQTTGIKIHQYAIEDDYFAWSMLANCCDAIISVCTSITHVAGAYGIPCLCMVPYRCAWRYGHYGNRMPWYSSVELVRQKQDDDWIEVIAEVRNKLVNIINASTNQKSKIMAAM